MAGDQAVERWGADGLFFTEAARGGPLAWRVGASALEGDALGPTRHVHDDAAEYYFMFSGAAHVETGGEELVLREGELGYIPPDAPHNFLGPASDADACLFCVVGPNHVANKWRLDDFRPGSEELRMSVGRPFDGQPGALPGGGTLSAEGIVMQPGDETRRVRAAGRELVYLVYEGAVDVSLVNGLHGRLERGTYLHVRELVEHELSAPVPCKILRIDCEFAMWLGAPRSATSPG